MALKAAKACGIAVVVLLLTGCWNRRELNELSIAVAMGLDSAEGGSYSVSVQIVNPGQMSSKKSGPDGVPVITYHTEARSVFEALRKLTTQVNRRIYMGHLRLLVIGEELARRGIADPIDFLSRDHELRTDFFITVAKNTRAQSILEMLTPEEKIPANEMYTSLEMSEKTWAATGKVTLDELLDDLESEGKSPVLTGLFIRGSAEKGKTLDNLQSTTAEAITVYDGMAVFRSDKLIGWLNEEESKGYHYTQNNVKSTIIVNDCLGGRMDVELLHAQTKVKAKIERGEPVVDIRVHAEGNVGDVACKLDLSNPSSIQQVEKWTEEHIGAVVADAVKTVQTRYKSDIFGFGEAVRRAEPARWREWKKNWAAIFEHMTVHTKVHVDIRRIGTINESILSKVRK